jgi:hypothetical protein
MEVMLYPSKNPNPSIYLFTTSFFFLSIRIISFFLLFSRDRVRDRNLTRSTAKPQGALGQVERIGYIPRNKVPVLQATGYQSSHMKGRKDSDELDAESRDGLARIQERDAEIDHSLGQVLNIVDNLDQIANAMNDEVTIMIQYHSLTILKLSLLNNIQVRQQEFKTRALESNLSIAEEKQAIVNARQKKLLKTS